MTAHKNGKSLGMVDPIALPKLQYPLFRLVHWHYPLFKSNLTTIFPCPRKIVPIPSNHSINNQQSIIIQSTINNHSINNHPIIQSTIIQSSNHPIIQSTIIQSTIIQSTIIQSFNQQSSNHLINNHPIIQSTIIQSFNQQSSNHLINNHPIISIPGYPRFGPINQRSHSARIAPWDGHRRGGAEGVSLHSRDQWGAGRRAERSDDMGEIPSGYLTVCHGKWMKMAHLQMVYLGLAINSMVIFHGELLNNQMVSEMYGQKSYIYIRRHMMTYGNNWKYIFTCMEIRGKMKGRWWMNQRVFFGISVKPWCLDVEKKIEVSRLKGSVGMFVWKLLKTAREPPRKWIRYDHLWNGTVGEQRRSRFQVVIGRHPDCNIQAPKRVSSEQFFCVLGCCGLVETQQFPDRCTDVLELFLGFREFETCPTWFLLLCLEVFSRFS